MKYKEIAKAWLNGEKVQGWDKYTGQWEDLGDPDNWKSCHTFEDYNEYRIKPKTTYRYFNIYNGDDKWGFVHYSVDDARSRICREDYIHTLKVGSDGSIEILVL